MMICSSPLASKQDPFPDEFLPESDVIDQVQCVEKREYGNLFLGKDHLRVTEGPNEGKYYAGPILSEAEAKQKKEEYDAHNAGMELRSPPPPRTRKNYPSEHASFASSPTPHPSTPVDQPQAQPRERPTARKIRQESRRIQEDEDAANAAAMELARLRESLDEKAVELNAVKDELKRVKTEYQSSKKTWSDLERKLKHDKRMLEKELKSHGKEIKRN
eukprot:CAMPEP_0178612396 /NCGR_PEP_ID=MMETSP0698-20121128/1105_1 /TAXON_ID=265572 /ORGANISM="Extubocellulus spinifer, Strain CCMP396" /LENGTH=216 /DNA_ID=CAMNT_0020251055 /DNA_START=557 /DNA_END=1209 /DNA_ORIENTATION=-